MPVRIRLARFGRKNRPFYRIHVADHRMKRDGRFLESLGTFDPIPSQEGKKMVRLNTDRVKYWLGVGAQPSKRVSFLLSQFSLIPTPPLATDFTFKRPPDFTEIPAWWQLSPPEQIHFQAQEAPQEQFEEYMKTRGEAKTAE